MVIRFIQGQVFSTSRLLIFLTRLFYLCRGAVYCPESLRCLAASLASVHCIPVALTSHLDNEKCLIIMQKLPGQGVGGVGKKSYPVENQWPALLLTRPPACCYPELTFPFYTGWLFPRPTSVLFKHRFLWAEHIMVGSTMAPVIPAS